MCNRQKLLLLWFCALCLFLGALSQAYPDTTNYKLTITELDNLLSTLSDEASGLKQDLQTLKDQMQSLELSLTISQSTINMLSTKLEAQSQELAQSKIEASALSDSLTQSVQLFAQYRRKAIRIGILASVLSALLGFAAGLLF